MSQTETLDGRSSPAAPVQTDSAQTKSAQTKRLGEARTFAPPPFPLGQATRSSWREGAITRANEMDALCAWLMSDAGAPPSAPLVAAATQHLQVARDAAESSYGFRRSLSGSTTERAESNLSAAEADLLRLAPLDYVRGQMPSLVAHVRRHLQANDSRRLRMERIWDEFVVHPDRQLSENERGQVVGIMRAAGSESAREKMRARSFRNVLVVTSLVLAVLAVGVGVYGWSNPTAIPLCFVPKINDQQVVVCPTEQSHLFQSATPSPNDPDIDDAVQRTVRPADILVVEALGLGAAALAAAVALRGIRGTSTPYSIPVALALLKLPSGALTAFFGLLLIRGQFFPGLSALDTSGQILAWAVLFGYGQQLFTRLVDQQAHNVLGAVGGAEHAEK